MENKNLENQSWQDNYNLLKEYVKDTGTFPEYGDTYKEVPLGRWLAHQMDNYSSGKLAKEHEELLTELFTAKQNTSTTSTTAYFS